MQTSCFTRVCRAEKLKRRFPRVLFNMQQPSERTCSLNPELLCTFIQAECSVHPVLTTDQLLLEQFRLMYLVQRHLNGYKGHESTGLISAHIFLACPGIRTSIITGHPHKPASQILVLTTPQTASMGCSVTTGTVTEVFNNSAHHTLNPHILNSLMGTWKCTISTRKI